MNESEYIDLAIFYLNSAAEAAWEALHYKDDYLDEGFLNIHQINKAIMKIKKDLEDSWLNYKDNKAKIDERFKKYKERHPTDWKFINQMDKQK